MTRDPSNCDLLDAVLAEIIEAKENGRPQDRERLLKQHPQFVAEIARYFRFDDQFEELCKSTLDPTESVPPRNELTATVDYHLPELLHERLPSVGELIDGKYRILDIKRGGMGCVYIVNGVNNWDDSPRGALKTVLPYKRSKKQPRLSPSAQIARYAALLVRFEREALNWVRLPKHDNIVNAVLVEELSGRPHLFLEYADSGDLSS